MLLRDKLYGLSTEVNRRITFHSCLIEPAGGPLEALMLSQAIFWQGVVGNTGWFYKTQKKWEEETGLSRTRQETCRKRLIARGLLREKRGGTNNKLFFQVANDKVEAIIAAGVQETCTPSSETTYDVNDRSVCRKPADRSAGFPHAKKSTQEEDLEDSLVVCRTLPSATTGKRTSFVKAKEEEGQGEEKRPKKRSKKDLEKPKAVPPPMDFGAAPRTPLVKPSPSVAFAGDGGAPPTRMELPPFNWPPKKSNDVYWFWATEVQAANPGFTPPFPGKGAPKVYSQCKKLLERAGSPETCAALIRVAVWDWKAIQETIESWRTNDRTVPDIQTILGLQTHLSAKLQTGVIGSSKRVSRYRSKFILKTEEKSKPKDGDGRSLAQRHRDAQREKRKAREAKKAAAG